MDFAANEVGWLPDTTKHGKSRVFQMSIALRAVLIAERVEREQFEEKARHSCPNGY